MYKTVGFELPLNAGNFYILDRKVVDVIKAMFERSRLRNYCYVHPRSRWGSINDVG